MSQNASVREMTPPMRIARIRIDEGFLAGLDLALSDGLNVLIGPRGVGKTSVIELVRFCLGAPSFTEHSAARTLEHARGVLAGGEVSVTLTDGLKEVVVSRTAADAMPRTEGQFRPPIVLSQNQIEAIATDPAGRLRLLDSFRQDRDKYRVFADRLRAKIKALTVEARGIAEEITSIEEQIDRIATEVAPLASLQEEHKGQLSRVHAAKAKQSQLSVVNEESAALSVALALYQRTQGAVGKWQHAVAQTADQFPYVEAWPNAAGMVDGLAIVRPKLATAEQSIKNTMAVLEDVRGELTKRVAATSARRAKLEAEARALRIELDAIQQGSGALARRIAELLEKNGQSGALKALMNSLTVKRATVIAARDALLDELDAASLEEFESRREVADTLNQALGPRIHVQVERHGLPTEYVDTIVDALRGSGLRYNTIAPIIAERISPRELGIAAENAAYDTVARLLGLAEERAARLLAEIAKSGTERIIVCDVQDIVTLSLLDGTEYKASESLSTGQRCTVVLPMLLSRPGNTLIIDQPEDHLDNAFIVDTAVAAIRRRSGGSQLLFSTHNPNIPVLGEATQVILLGSDGSRGFVRHSGPLDDPRSVAAISSVMEGGMDAFRRRFAFYSGQ